MRSFTHIPRDQPLSVWHDFSIYFCTQTQLSVLISSSESLTIQVVKNAWKLAVFTWRGSPSPEARTKTAPSSRWKPLPRQSECKSDIVLNARAHSGNTTEAYIDLLPSNRLSITLAIARASYRMAVVPPVDPSSPKHAVTLYIAALNKVLKKRFVAGDPKRDDEQKHSNGSSIQKSFGFLNPEGEIGYFLSKKLRSIPGMTLSAFL